MANRPVPSQWKRRVRRGDGAETTLHNSTAVQTLDRNGGLECLVRKGGGRNLHGRRRIDSRVRYPASEERTPNIRPSVHQAHDQLVASCPFGDAVDSREEEIRSVRSGLVPALNSCTDCTRDNSQIKLEWQPPFMFLLHAKYLFLVGGELFITAKILKVVGILGQESSFAQHRKSMDQVLLFSKRLDVAHQLVSRNALERVLDLGLQIPVDVDSFLELVDMISIVSSLESASRVGQGGLFTRS